MKAICGLLMALLATICLNTHAQKTAEFPTDSLMKEIVHFLNDNKWTFWIDENGTNSRYRTKVLEITFNSDSLCFISENGAKKVSLFQIIRLSEEKGNQGEPNYKMISIGSDVLITRHISNYSPGSKKSIAYAGETNKQMSELYEILLPFDKKYLEDQQTAVNEKFARSLEEFQKVVDDYNNMTVKPTMTEEQRKYIVQANALNEEKNYGKALEAYDKALKINPVTYPSAYYNMALLSVACVKDYKSAILYMKKYLMLKPYAEDARAAQDKIYEWEYNIQE